MGIETVVYGGIMANINTLSNLPVSIVKMKMLDENSDKRCLVYLPLDESIIGRNVDIITHFDEENKTIQQEVSGADFFTGITLDFKIAQDYLEKVEERGYLL